MGFDNYPSLTRDEFTEVCHELDRRYCQATLGPVRRLWKLRLCTALDTIFSPDGGYITYLQIIRPLDGTLDHDDLSLDLDKFTFGDDSSTKDHLMMNDKDMMDAEEDDEAAVIKRRAVPDFGHVVYEIHLHPTYRVPCLWFTLKSLPLDEPEFNIDTVFRRLVPDAYKDGLRRQGAVGGISADHHPMTGVPTFFLHPCLVGENMLQFSCSKEDYLMVWLGLTGSCVGLHVPKEMAIQ
ncbi:autophagocytosis associated protein, active-site domain-containing protein [Sarocladium implicatum]|nr:autophagocytosis associated protein, active-site domain-containing protein [Sarocladium implicatum]